LLFLLLPFMALVSYAMAFRKNRYYYDHFIFSTETLSFFILFGFLLLPLLVRGMYIAGMTWINSEIVIGIILYGLFAVYASLAAGRFFNLRLGWRILYGTVFSMLLFVFLIFVYRLVLFWVVIHLL
ncbi:MAG TPA: hypothetical protein VEB86_19335, partial [Chryseosolibacter sp.]|nr:hypothetical protein [Chryseosolibacter sp.]